MPKKKDERQLMLDFESRKKELHEAADRFVEAAKRLAAGAVSKEDPRVIEAKRVREQVRQVVGILVDQSGMDFHTVWVLAYHELFKATGYHAVPDSVEHRDKVHLDAVQRSGKLGDLLRTVCQMLTMKCYARGGAA